MTLPEAGTGGIAAVIVSEVFELVKRTSFLRFINCDTETLNRVLGGLIAFATGLGLQVHFDRETGDLLIRGLLLSSVWHGFGQWAAQQIYYRLAVAQRAVHVNVTHPVPTVDASPFTKP